jgi:hypothetical protein
MCRLRSTNQVHPIEKCYGDHLLTQIYITLYETWATRHASVKEYANLPLR